MRKNEKEAPRRASVGPAVRRTQVSSSQEKKGVSRRGRRGYNEARATVVGWVSLAVEHDERFGERDELALELVDP